MKYFLAILLLLPSLAFAVDEATVQAIDTKASEAKAKADGNNSRIQDLEAAVAALEGQVAYLLQENMALAARLACVSSQSNAENFVFSGCNVHVRNNDELQRTNSTNGKGNLILGYNEDYLIAQGDLGILSRGGSHNLVIGRGHSYSSFGGAVMGLNNSMTQQYATVLGGFNNAATGARSVVAGGQQNEASGPDSSVSGGILNRATVELASVSGGAGNQAGGLRSSVAGGAGNKALGISSSVSGGRANVAEGNFSSVSGGNSRTAPGQDSWAAGGFLEPN